MTSQEKISAIYEARRNGGYDPWAPLDTGCDVDVESNSIHVFYKTMGEVVRVRIAIIEFLLEPQGLKATYGNTMIIKEMFAFQQEQTVENKNSNSQKQTPMKVALQITETWMRSGGDAIATIDTAFSLLP